jgi:hypothetical protein
MDLASAAATRFPADYGEARERFHRAARQVLRQAARGLAST